MALQRYTRAVDGTIPVSALLYDDEELLATQDNTGIYDGTQKSPDHQSGTVHVTTHRLFYISDGRSRDRFSKSFALDLGTVARTEYYAGLFTSSPKVTVHLAPSAGVGSNEGGDMDQNLFESWECEVCGNRNPPGLSPTAAKICALCGVPRSSVPVVSPILSSKPNLGANQGHISSSLPSSVLPSPLTSSTSLSSRFGLSASPSPSPTPPPKPKPNPIQTSQPSTIACPVCTFLNHPSMRSCEMCSTPLPRLTAPSSSQLQVPSGASTKSAPATRPASPDGVEGGHDIADPTRNMMRLSFRKGGDKAFYSVLKRSLMGKTWEGRTIGKGRSNASVTNINSDPNTGRSGIHGILRTVETSAQNAATDMSDALKDLEALMVKAKDMVRLAGELNERLTASSTTTTTSIAIANMAPARSSTPSFLALPSTPSTPTRSPSPAMFTTPTLVPSTEPEEATFIRSSLSQLGLQMSNAPVTLDMIRDERRWVEELARELGEVLQGSRNDGGFSKRSGVGMMRERGIIALDEVWGGWNRARGVALIPPSTFLQVLPHLPYATSPPISFRTFSSGLSVLHTPPYTHAAFSARIVTLLFLVGPKTTAEIAREEDLTVGLAAEMVEAVEDDGEICRDDAGANAIKGGGSGSGGGEIRWWRNVFRGYVWDGQE